MGGIIYVLFNLTKFRFHINMYILKWNNFELKENVKYLYAQMKCLYYFKLDKFYKIIDILPN